MGALSLPPGSDSLEHRERPPAAVFNPLKSMTVPVSNRNGERGSPARNDTESPLKLTRTPAANPQVGVARGTCPDSFDIEFWWVSNAD